MNSKRLFLQPRLTFFMNIVIILAMMMTPTFPGGDTAKAQAENPTPTPVLILPPDDEPLPDATPQPSGGQDEDASTNAVLDSNNVSLIGQFGGALRSVALDGIYAYAGGGNRMVVMNTSASPPTIVSRTQLFADDVYDIAIFSISSVKYAFLAVGSAGIKIVNITDPTNPMLVGSGYNTNGVAKGVAVASISGTAYAFVADGANGALSLNVSTPSAPTVVDTLAATNSVTSIAVSNLGAATYYAYVADLGAGIIQYDVTTTAGEFTATGNTDAGASTNPNDVFVTNVGATYYVVVADGANFRRFDSILGGGTSLAATDAQSVFGLGNYAYVSDGSSGDVLKIDISAALALSCTYAGSGTAYGLAVDGSGNNIYLAEWGYGLRVITAATCASSAIRYSPSVIDLALEGNYGYLAADMGGLQILDISTPAAPAAPTSANYGAEATLKYTKRVRLLGSDAYVTGGTAALDQHRKITISTPASPAESVTDASWLAIPNGVAVDGSLTYVAINDGLASSGLYVRNTSDLSASTAYVGVTMAPEDIVVTSAYVYVADGANGFKIFNKANILGGPVAARTYNTIGSAVGLAISSDEHYAYVADDNNGLVALNISSTSITTLADSLSLAGNAKDVAISGNYAYVAADTGGLRVVDISDPTNLREVGFYSTPGNALRVEVSGAYTYVACNTAGLLVLQYPASTYTVTGKITDTSTATGLPGVVVTASFGRSATSDSSGNYSIVDIPAGSFSLTAAMPGYSCMPALVTGTAPGDLTGKNFSCTPGAVGPYTVSGRVIDLSSLPIANVTVMLNNGLSATTNGSGNYTISNVPLGTYTILPTRSGYTFSPVSTTVSVSSNLSNQNFTGSVVSGGTYTVSGTVTSDGITPISGVTVYASNGLTAVTGATGTYSMSTFGAGTFAVMPASSSWMFSPVSATITLSAGSPSATQNFIGSTIPPAYSISGQITDGSGNPIADVTVYLNTGLSTTTNASGNYGFSGLAVGSYTIMPSKSGYTFSPVVTTVYVTAEAEVDATASFSGSVSPAGSYVVSGRITDGMSGLSGISVYASNGLTSVSDSSGNYSLTGFSAGTFAVMPISAGSVFTPVSRSVSPSALSPTISGQDFVRGGGPSGPYSVSGRITDSLTSSPIASVLITDGAGHIAYSDGAGNYILSGLSAGSYTLTAFMSGYTFVASFTNPVTIVAANLTDKNFVGTSGSGNYTISGRITDGTNPIQGVTVSDGTRSATTNINGDYTITDVPYGSYIITPSMSGYSFSPAVMSVIVPPNATNKNFTATAQPTYTISGRVTDSNGDPVANVSITDGSGRTTSSDYNGNYTFTGIPAGPYTLTPSKSGNSFTPTTQVGSVPPNAVNRNFTAVPEATYTVSGRVTYLDGQPISGVTVTDAGGRSGVSDSNGDYTIIGVPKGNYALTASKSGHIFSPNPLVGSVPPNATKQNFYGMKGNPTPMPTGFPVTPGTPSPSTGSTISGTIRDGSGSPMPGVNISDGQGRTTTSDSFGNYILSGYVSGSYNITATRSGYSCTPYPILVTVPPSATADFTCSVVYYTVSGMVTDANNKAISSVTISAGSGYTVMTDASGNYTLSLPLGTYILTPSKTNFVFSPSSRSVNVSSNVGGQIFYGATGITDSVKNGNMETDEGWVMPFKRAGYSTSEADDIWAEIEDTPLDVEPDSATVELLKDMTADYATEEVLSGTRSLRVGIVDAMKNVAGYSEARQYVQIPWSAKTAVLRFWLFPKGGEPDGKDLQIVTLLTPQMKQKERLLTMRSNSAKWEYHEYNLTKYRGQSFWIYFGVYNDGKGSIMGMYVDDVALLGASTDVPPLPPVTPGSTTTPGPGPTITPSPGGYSISGRVMSTSGIALAGVSILASDGHMAVTNVNGDYVLSGMAAGTFTVTPYLVGSSFSPSSTTVTLSAANPSVSAINFTATPLTPTGSLSVSGLIKDTGDVPIGNVTIIDGVGHTTTSTASGEYTLSSMAAGTYTISPAVAGYVFSPASRTITLSVSMTGQDFTGTAVSGGSYTVSGRVTDTSGVAVSGATVASNDGHTATTNSNGDYTITSLTAGSYVISPSKPSYTFIPVAQTVSLSNLNNATGVNFTGYSGTYPSYSISGRVTLGTAGLADVTVSDANGHTALTNSNGDYSLSGLYAGSYTISATKEYYAFSASFTNPVAVASSNVTGKDFVASAAPVSRTNPDSMKAYFIPASAKPKIDGDFPSSSTDYPDPTQWNTYKKDVQYKIVGRSKMGGQDTYGVWDIKADVLFGWDEEYFYIFSKVYDDIYVQEADDYTFLYRGDSVEYAMDLEVAKDYSSTTLSSDDYRVGMSGATHNPSNRDYKTIVWSPSDKTGIPSWVNMAARSFCELNAPWVCYDTSPPPAKYIDYTGYMLEAAVRWSGMGVDDPEAGDHFGFAFTVNDNDQIKKEIQEKVISTVNDSNVFFDPTTWSDIELVN